MEDDKEIPITFLHAEISEFNIADNQENGFVAERDTFDLGSGDSDTA